MKTLSTFIGFVLLGLALAHCASASQIEVVEPVSGSAQSELRSAADQTPEVVTGEGAEQLFQLMSDYNLFREGVAAGSVSEGSRVFLFGSRFVCRGPSESALENEDHSQYYCELDSEPIEGQAAARLFERLNELNLSNDTLVWDEGSDSSIVFALNRAACSFGQGESPICTIESIPSVL